MTQAQINIQESSNRILNIVKAQHGLKDKSQAIDLVVTIYGQTLLEPELRPEFIKKMQDVEDEEFVEYASVEDLRKAIEDA